MNKKVSIIIAGMMAVGMLVGCGDKKDVAEDETVAVSGAANKEDEAKEDIQDTTKPGEAGEDAIVDDSGEDVTQEEKVIPVEEASTMENVNTVGPQYNSIKGSQEYKEEEDLNGDGIIDIYDIVLKAKKEEN